MARLKITGPDGRTIVLNAPDGATNEQIQEKISQIKSQWGGQQAQQPEQPVATQQQPGVSGWEAAGRGALQGLSLGFGDELYGAGAGAVDFLKGEGFNYSTNRDEARAANDRAREAHPGAYLAGEIGGGVALPFGAAGLAARGGAAGLAAGRVTGLAPEVVAATMPGRIAQGAGQGARVGAAYGLGTSNADLTEGDVSGTLAETAKGAAGGALLGGALTPAVDVGAAVLRRAAQPFRGYTNPTGVGTEKLAEALARDAGSSGTPADIARAVQRINSRAAAAADDPTMMLGDIGGENTRRLMRQANNMPNDNVQRFNRRLDTRQNFQWQRIEREMARTLRDPRDYAETVGDIVTRRGQQAAPNFQAAMAVDVPMTPQLNAVLKRPGMQNIIRNVEASLANEGQAIGRETRMQAIHRLKVEIDTQIGQARRAQAMGNDRTAGMDARTLTIMKRDLLAAVDNPQYRQALDAFAGESALANAAEDGFESALRMHVEEIGPMLRGMTSSEADMWRLGAARALAGRIRQGNVTRDRTENLFSSPDIQMRMEALFPNNRARRQFQRMLTREARKADLRKEVQGGSKTDRNLQTASEAGAPMRAAVSASQLLSGRLEPVLNAIGRTANRFSGLTPGSANSILEMGMRPAAQGIDDQIIQILRRRARAPQQRSNYVRGMAAALAGPLNDDAPLRGGIGPRYQDGSPIR